MDTRHWGTMHRALRPVIEREPDASLDDAQGRAGAWVRTLASDSRSRSGALAHRLGVAGIPDPRRA
jgi:hypothetical protein